MFDNGIGVSSAIIINIDETLFKDKNDLLSYDLWCDALESKIHLERDISDKLEEFKPLTWEVDMTCDWVKKIF